MPQNLLQKNSANKKVCLNSLIRTFVICVVSYASFHCIYANAGVSFFLWCYKNVRCSEQQFSNKHVGIRRISVIQSTCIRHKLPSPLAEQKPGSASDFYVPLKTIKKFSKVIVYHQPDLSTDRTVYASCLQLDSEIGQLKGHVTLHACVSGQNTSCARCCLAFYQVNSCFFFYERI